MFSHLNINSRHIIHSLCKDGKATLGAKTVDISNESSREMLALVSINLKSLITLNGKDLVNNVKLLMENFNFENIKNQINDLKYEKTQQAENFKLGKIKVCSFRGLAPLGREWEYDFNCKSHLILGPNGSGKSSLLGAICWCLTGKYFRDDCPPCEPEKITAYPLNDKAGKKIKDRDDAQSLLDENGTCSLIVPYWVEIELIGRTKKLILRRKNVDGLTVKNDGEEWRKITSIKEADIDELDCELRLLMPAKISHIKLGKNPDVLRLLAEITGYGDLEIVSQLAEDLVTSSRRMATAIENKEMPPQKTTIDTCITNIKEIATTKVKELPAYEKIDKTDRTLDDVKDFGIAINEQIEIVKSQLASDLSLEIPNKENAEAFRVWQDKSTNLP
ncbi:MAG: AAA family ATPase, partial [Candidatus Methanofastidiosa archaeon]|nr:AAA family ATPase [Candidatus Methanofastidiosa archaeon]